MSIGQEFPKARARQKSPHTNELNNLTSQTQQSTSATTDSQQLKRRSSQKISSQHRHRYNQHSVRLATAYNHHHKTIQRLVNKHCTRFRTKQNGNPELPRNITMCYRRNPSLRNKLAETRYIQELATPTNRPTLKPHCANKCWNRKCPTCPDIPTRHQFLRTTLGTTHTTKCNYPCRSNGIVYLVTCKDATNSISAKH